MEVLRSLVKLFDQVVQPPTMDAECPECDEENDEGGGRKHAELLPRTTPSHPKAGPKPDGGTASNSKKDTRTAEEREFELQELWKCQT